MSRILHLSDIHFGCENKAAVAATLELAHAEPFALTVISGDITQFGHVGEFEAARDWVSLLPGPVLVCPGNHDTPYAGVIARLFAPFARYSRYFGSTEDAFADAGMAVRAFNTARGWQIRLNWSKGEASRRDAARCASGLAAAKGLKIAVCHHPLMEVLGGPMTGRVRGGRRASGILAEGGVDLILSGHVHTPFTITLPCADGLTHQVGAATLSMRERGMPAGFNIIEWDDETITVTAQGWTGSHFEPSRTWALPRRKAAR